MSNDHVKDLSKQDTTSIENVPGYRRFAVQLSAVRELLTQSIAGENPVASFFKGNGRQCFFYLESLCRIYRELHDRELFEKLRKEFKSLEDQLGRFDFYSAWVNEFSLVADFPPPLLNYFKSRANDEMIAAEKMMSEKKWTVGASRIEEVLVELKGAKWMDGENDREAIRQFLIAELNDFIKDYERGKYNLQLLEEGIHEFRRDIRWFSIYAQALDGLIQLKERHDTDLEKYGIDEVKNSPYNKFPELQDKVKPIFIGSDCFYALSWIINELGLLKDAGLKITALTEAGKESGAYKEAVIYISSLSMKNQRTLKEIQGRVEDIVTTFMRDDKALKRIKNDIRDG